MFLTESGTVMCTRAQARGMFIESLKDHVNLADYYRFENKVDELFEEWMENPRNHRIPELAAKGLASIGK